MEPDDTDSIELIKNNLRSRLQEVRQRLLTTFNAKPTLVYTNEESIVATSL